MVLGRCAFSRFCAKTMLKPCSRSLHPSLRSTAQCFEQGDLAACEAWIYWILLDLLYLWAETQILLIAISLILVPCTKGWLEKHLKWNRDDQVSLLYLIDTEVSKWTCLSAPRRVPQLVDELNFEELALNMESLYAKQTRTDFGCSK